MRSKTTYRHKSKDKKPGITYKDGKANGGFEPGLVSIIAPCYNELENIEPFLIAVSKIDFAPYRTEVILVNDGSRDGTGLAMERHKLDFPGLRTIHFTGNFGQQQALMAGIRNARGEILVTLDVDLQQPPEYIPAMISQYERGHDAVYSIPEYRQNSATWLKKLTSTLYYRLMRRQSFSGVVYKSNDFRLISHRVATVIRALPERNLYLRGIVATLCPVIPHSNNRLEDSGLWKGSTITYPRKPRIRGRTKYTWHKMIRLAFDGLTATSTVPLRYGIILGLGSIGAATALTFWALYVHFITNSTVPGWTSLMIVLLFFSSMQFLLIGLLGEYIGKIFLQVRGRPGYIVQSEEIISIDPGTDRLLQKGITRKPVSRDTSIRKFGNGAINDYNEAVSRHPP